MSYGKPGWCDAEEAIERNAAGRFGIVTRADCRAHGLSEDAIDRRRQSRWEPMYPGIYRLRNFPSSLKQELYAACLHGGTGAVAFGPAAAFLHGLDDFEGARPEVAASRHVRAARAVTFRRIEIPARHRHFRYGIPVIEPTRLLVHLGAAVSEERLEFAVDQCLRDRKTHLDVLQRRLTEVGGKGVLGSKMMRKLMRELEQAKSPTGSVLEVKLRRLVRRYRLPQPEGQFPVLGGRYWIDFAYPQEMIAIEAEGYAFHSGRRRWRSDLERRNVLTSLGWRVYVYPWEKVVREPEAVAMQIRAALGL